jgi:hypothetical protein
MELPQTFLAVLPLNYKYMASSPTLLVSDHTCHDICLAARPRTAQNAAPRNGWGLGCATLPANVDLSVLGKTYGHWLSTAVQTVPPLSILRESGQASFLWQLPANHPRG